jgi:hypothetical protein
MEATARALENKNVDPSTVKGWAVDADPENDPAYPMKIRDTTVDHAGYTWDRPDKQPVNVEVLHSNERPNVSAAFGTTLPPSGLSGLIRRAAFNHSEDRYRHWLPLMLADRVQMVEGVLDDIARGHVPNFFGEMGWKADWKYNRKALITKVAVGAALGAGLLSLIASRRSSENRS